MNKIFLDNSIGEIIAKYKKGKLLPEDVFTATLANIKEFDSKYFPFVCFMDNKALKDLKNTDRPNGLLYNIPMGVKDIYNTYEFPTEMGSPIWKDFTPGNDARTVFNLKRQGGATIGKTVTAEFAVHALEKTLNPWDVTKTPGTSSSGSAVAITLGIVPFATGSQTAGSIVRPASFCGVYGCKPSFGTIPRTGTLKTTDSLDTLGFFTIHQKDLRRGFDSMRIEGLDYPISNAALTDPKRQNKNPKKPWRVAFVKTHTWQYAPGYAKNQLEEFIQKISKDKNIQIKEMNLPKGMSEAHSIHETIYNKSLSYYFQNEHEKPEFVSPVMNELITKGQRITPSQFQKALNDQTDLIHDMDTFFDKFDIIISLSTAGEAPPRAITELPDPALMWTLTHLPVVSVPNFRSPSGLPFGMQVVARKYNDYLLFSFLDYLEKLKQIPSKAGYFIKNKA